MYSMSKSKYSFLIGFTNQVKQALDADERDLIRDLAFALQDAFDECGIVLVTEGDDDDEPDDEAHAAEGSPAGLDGGQSDSRDARMRTPHRAAPRSEREARVDSGVEPPLDHVERRPELGPRPLVRAIRGQR